MLRILYFVRSIPILRFRIGISLCFLFLLLVTATAVLAQRAESRSPPIILTDAQGENPLAPNLELLRDPPRQLTIQDVTSPAYSVQFSPNKQQVPNFGITTDAVWVRFRVLNNASNSASWLLALQEYRHGKVDFYRPTAAGSFQVKQTGRDLPFSSREIADREYVFRLDLPRGAEQTFYLRLASNSPMIIPLTIWSTEALAQSDQREMFLYGLFYGAMVIIAAYNLFLFVALRDPSYLYLALFILFYSFNQGARDGMAQQYIYPGYSNRYVNELTAIPWTIFLILFSTQLLETRTRVPRLHRLLLAIIVIFPVWFLFHLFVPSNIIGLLLIQLSLVLLGVAGYLVWRQGYRPARYYLLSWAMFFIAAFVFILNGFALIPNFSFSDGPLLAAAVLGALLGSLALADRVNLFRADTEKSHRELELSESKYRSLFDNSRDGILVTTREGQLIDANPTLMDMFGLIRSDLATANARDFYFDAAERAKLLRAVDERGFIQDYQVLLRRPDGSAMPALLSLTGWQHEQSGQVGFQGTIRDLTEQQRIEQERAQQQTHLTEAVADERVRLARDLHDSVTQSLYSIGAYANAASRALQMHKNDLGAEHIKQIIQLALEAMVDMRSYIFELRPPALEKEGLAAALQTRLQAVEGRAGVAIEFHTHGNDGLAPQVQTELYRIAQEALTNVVKHAHAKHVKVNLDYEPDYVVLEVRDDGDGIELARAQQKDTMGLRGIAERTQKINGVLTVEGKPGQGTLVRVEVPYE